MGKYKKQIDVDFDTWKSNSTNHTNSRTVRPNNNRSITKINCGSINYVKRKETSDSFSSKGNILFSINFILYRIQIYLLFIIS